MKIQFMMIAGLDISCMAMRFSFNSESKQKAKTESGGFTLWEDDVKLLSNLVKRGDSHAKVLRMANVYCKITAPRYWWQEFDTYTQGVVRMSQSTVHTITKRHLSPDDFEGGMSADAINSLNSIIDSKDMLTVKRNLPESFLQARIVVMNYQAIRHIYLDRKSHKLPEWHTFISAMNLLPFYKEFIEIT